MDQFISSSTVDTLSPGSDSEEGTRWWRHLIIDACASHCLLETLHGDNTDADLVRRQLCSATIPEQDWLAQDFNDFLFRLESQPENMPKTSGVSYLHKIGPLFMAAGVFGLSVCVETGTHTAETAILLGALCEQVYTIELDPSLARAARNTLEFANAKYKRNITLWEGNSGELLWHSEIQKEPRPILFWLDGHASGGDTAQLKTSEYSHFGSPVLDEVKAVLARKNDGDVIVIDDTHSFLNSAPGYPSVMDIMQVVCQHAPTWRVQVTNREAIRIYKRRAPKALSHSCLAYGGYLEDLQSSYGEQHCSKDNREGVDRWDEVEFPDCMVSFPPAF